jgi:hypothetical protein
VQPAATLADDSFDGGREGPRQHLHEERHRNGRLGQYIEQPVDVGARVADRVVGRSASKINAIGTEPLTAAAFACAISRPSPADRRLST